MGAGTALSAAALAFTAGLCTPSAAHADETLYALLGPTIPLLIVLDKNNGNWIDTFDVFGNEALFGGLAADPTANGGLGSLYSIDGYNDPNSDRFFAIDPASGNGHVVGETGENWNFRAVCRNPVTGVMWASRDSYLYTIDTATGVATQIVQVTGSTLDQMTTIAINQRGEFYGSDIGDAGLFKIDPVTGNADHIGNMGGNWMNDMTFDSNGVLYGAPRGQDVVTIDVSTAITTFAFSGAYEGLVFMFEASCYADCDTSTGVGVLDVFDFLCFQDSFVNGNTYACDCDTSTGVGVCDIFDFLCFQDAFVGGCP